MKVKLIPNLLFSSLVLPSLTWVISSSAQAGLIAVYEFNETTGNTAVDTMRPGSGNGVLFNFSGSQWGAGKIGNALTFDGSDDYVNALNAVPTGSTSFTISVWVNAVAATSWSTIVKNWGVDTVGSFHLGINSTANRLGNYLTTGTQTQATSNLTLNAWNHVAVTYNGATSTQRLYVNGTLVNTQTNAPTSLTALGTRMGIGVKLNEPAQDAPAPGFSLPGHWNGRMDDLAFWDETLSDAQILEIRNKGEAGIGVLDTLITKAGTGSDLNDTVGWSEGSAPASNSVAAWKGTSLGTGLTLGAPASWKGIIIDGAASDIDITGNGNLTLGSIGIGMSTSPVNLSMSQPITLGANQTWTVGNGRLLTSVGDISGTFGLTKAGAGTLTIHGGLSHTAATTVSAGTLILSGNNVAATGGMMLNGGITQFNTVASINGTAPDVTINTSGVVVFGPSFGTGTDIQNALSNRIDVSSKGVIAADNHATTNFDFSVPDLFNAFFHSVGSVIYTGTLTPAGTTYRLGGAGGTLTMANTNAITGIGNSLVVQGNVTLAAANDFDIGTTLSSGTLAVGHNDSLGSGSLTINGGTIQSADANSRVLANDLVVGSNITVGGTGNMTFSNTLDTALGATRTFTINNPSSTFAQAFTGAFGITKAGTGAMTLSGANTYTNTTTVSAGTLTLLGSNNSTGTTAVNAGTLQLGGTINAGLASGTINLGNAASGLAVIQAVNADQTITNAVLLNNTHGTISGAHSLLVNGTFTNGASSRTLTNNIDAGKTLTLAGQVSLATTTTNRTLIIAGSGTTIMSGALVNTSTGNGSLTKSGSGLLTLTNTNTFRGATTVQQGTLALSGSGSINDSTGTTVNGAAFMQNSSVIYSRPFAFNVSVGGTLGGTGTISSAITAGFNAIIAPGDRTLATPAKGTLTVTNGVSLTDATSQLAVRLFGPTTNDSDKLVQSTTGTVGFGGTLRVTFSGTWTPVAGTTYDLIDWTGTPTGTFSTITLPTLPAGLKWRNFGSGVLFDYATGQIQIEADLPGYASWQSANVATGQNSQQDHDNDGVQNGVEFFIGGPNGITTGFTPLPGVVNTAGVLSVTWTKAADYNGVYGSDYVIETSDTLTGSWTSETLGVNVIITGNDVKLTFPTPLGSKKFARLKVTSP